MLKINHKYKIRQRGTGDNLIIHICAIVDEDMVVYKYYGRHRRRWYYIVESMYILNDKLIEERSSAKLNLETDQREVSDA